MSAGAHNIPPERLEELYEALLAEEGKRIPGLLARLHKRLDREWPFCVVPVVAEKKSWGGRFVLGMVATAMVFAVVIGLYQWRSNPGRNSITTAERRSPSPRLAAPNSDIVRSSPSPLYAQKKSEPSFSSSRAHTISPNRVTPPQLSTNLDGAIGHQHKGVPSPPRQGRGRLAPSLSRTREQDPGHPATEQALTQLRQEIQDLRAAVGELNQAVLEQYKASKQTEPTKPEAKTLAVAKPRVAILEFSDADVREDAKVFEDQRIGRTLAFLLKERLERDGVECQVVVTTATDDAGLAMLGRELHVGHVLVGNITNLLNRADEKRLMLPNPFGAARRSAQLQLRAEARLIDVNTKQPVQVAVIESGPSRPISVVPRDIGLFATPPPSKKTRDNFTDPEPILRIAMDALVQDIALRVLAPHISPHR